MSRKRKNKNNPTAQGRKTQTQKNPAQKNPAQKNPAQKNPAQKNPETIRPSTEGEPSARAWDHILGEKDPGDIQGTAQALCQEEFGYRFDGGTRQAFWTNLTDTQTGRVVPTILSFHTKPIGELCSKCSMEAILKGWLDDEDQPQDEMAGEEDQADPKIQVQTTPKNSGAASETTPAQPSVDATDEVLNETPEEVPDETPDEVLNETPEEVPDETPDEVLNETPEEVPDETPDEVLNETPEEVPDETPDEVLNETPEEVPDETPDEVLNETPEEVPDETPDEVLNETPEEVPDETPDEVLNETPDAGGSPGRSDETSTNTDRQDTTENAQGHAQRQQDEQRATPRYGGSNQPADGGHTSDPARRSRQPKPVHHDPPIGIAQHSRRVQGRGQSRDAGETQELRDGAERLGMSPRGGRLHPGLPRADEPGGEENGPQTDGGRIYQTAHLAQKP